MRAADRYKAGLTKAAALRNSTYRWNLGWWRCHSHVVIWPQARSTPGIVHIQEFVQVKGPCRSSKLVHFWPERYSLGLEAVGDPNRMARCPAARLLHVKYVVRVAEKMCSQLAEGLGDGAAHHTDEAIHDQLLDW